MQINKVFISFKAKFEALESKLYINKFHYLLILLVLLSLPLIVVAAKSQTNTTTHADNSTVLADQGSEAVEDDDNLPPEPTNIPISSAAALAAYNAQTAQVDSASSVKTTTTKPNIVVIMTDDVNPLDGRLWKQTRTPNIYNDIIAKGIQFTNYYGETPLCCPGRVGFLTGQHTQNHGIGNLDGEKFNPKETIATELQGAGYYTMLTGKYVNNYNLVPRAKAIPPGWSKFDAIYEANGKYFYYNWLSKDGSMVYHGGNSTDYSTDVIANTAIQRLKQAPANKPIFAYITPFASHDPTKPPPRYVGDSRCKNIDPWNPPNYNEANVSDKPQYIQELPIKAPETPAGGFNLVTKCETQLAVDDMVGRVVKELKAEGRLNNTVLVFTTDNGMSWGAHRWEAKAVPYATQMPLYITWPSGGDKTAKLENTTLSDIDFAPTLCAIAGCAMGPYPNGQDIADGLNFLPLLKNQPVAWTRDAILETQPATNPPTTTHHRPPWWAVRTTAQNPLGLWHYIEYDDGEKELYDLSHGPCYSWTPSKGGDPCELNNLLGPKAKQTAYTLSIASQLHDRLIRLKGEKGSIKPTPTLSPTPTITPAATLTPTLTPAPTSPVNPQSQTSATTGSLKFNAGSYYTYKLSGSIASDRQLFSITNNKTWQTTAPAVSATYNGTKLNLVKLTGANGQTSLVGRYISTSVGTWTSQ